MEADIWALGHQIEFNGRYLSFAKDQLVAKKIQSLDTFPTDFSEILVTMFHTVNHTFIKRLSL